MDTSIQCYADRQELQITAHVTRDGGLQPAGFNEIRQTVDLEAEQVQTATGQTEPIHSGIRLSIYSPRPNSAVQTENPEATPIPSMPLFHYGERIRFSTKLKRPRNFRNPGAFDYQSYLADHNIAALGSTKIENVERLPGFAGSRIAFWRSHLHRGVVSKVHQLWPPREAALIDAMVIGEEAFIDRDTRVDFQRSGTYHILVVSGMNVSILAFVVFWTLRRLRLGSLPATLLTVGLCIAYACITEVGAPVWRATLMCARRRAKYAAAVTNAAHAIPPPERGPREIYSRDNTQRVGHRRPEHGLAAGFEVEHRRAGGSGRRSHETGAVAIPIYGPEYAAGFRPSRTAEAAVATWSHRTR